MTEVQVQRQADLEERPHDELVGGEGWEFGDLDIVAGFRVVVGFDMGRRRREAKRLTRQHASRENVVHLISLKRRKGRLYSTNSLLIYEYYQVLVLSFSFNLGPLQLYLVTSSK